MKIYKHHSLPRQRGIAAVELALILPFMVLMLAAPLYFGRVFWHYSVVERAAGDAARYLASVPIAEMKDPNRAGDVVAVAQAIVATEISELNPGNFPPGVTIQCDNLGCFGFSTPSTVSVGIQLYVENVFFPGIWSMSLPVTANVCYPYIGI